MRLKTGRGYVRQSNKALVPVQTQSDGGRPIVRENETVRLIERTRQLMEQTIEFVSHPDFDLRDFEKGLSVPAFEAVDSRQCVNRDAPGQAFVTGLVRAPLLTADEEKYLFTRMNYLKWRAEQNRRLLDLRHPDSGRVDRIQIDLNEATVIRNRIAQGNLRLIVALAKKLSSSVDQMSDLIGEGMAPLIRAVELFDVRLGNRFSTYATWAARNQMLRWLKRTRMTPERTLGEDAPSMDNLPAADPVAEHDDCSSQIRVDAVHRLLCSLPDRERQIVAARFGLEGQPHGQSLAEIAAQMSLSKERVRQIVMQSLLKLKSELTYEEFEAMN